MSISIRKNDVAAFARTRKEALDDAFYKGKSILMSIASPVPGVGSFASELVDFVLEN